MYYEKFWQPSVSAISESLTLVWYQGLDLDNLLGSKRLNTRPEAHIPENTGTNSRF